MSGSTQEDGIGDSCAAASATSSRQLSIEERRRVVAASLRVGNPGNNSGELPNQADPRHECHIELEIDDIRPYENNPRRADNARFPEIKESIRSNGIRNPLAVTRRPGEQHFIVEAGGNTRLLAIRQLWTETQDARFRKLKVLFRPWRSEAHVLTSHLIENELRGEMTFWDKASGVVALKVRLEAQTGCALSLRQLEQEMKGLGLAVNTATLAHYLFATERLRALGEGVADLSGLDVKTMQPRLNQMKRHAQARASLAESELYARVFEPVFRQAADQFRNSRSFSASKVCISCEEALARELGEPVEIVRAAIEAYGKTSPGSSDPVLEARPASQTNQREATGSTAASGPSSSETVVSSADAGTIAAGPQSPSESAPKLPDIHPEVPSRLTEHIRIFAALAGIGDCVHVSAAAPLGYTVDDLPTPPIGDASPPPIRQQAWWLLAILAGQSDGSVPACIPELPRAVAARANDDVGQGASDPPPSPGDAALIRWLVDAHDEAANAFWNVLALVRQRKASALSDRTMKSPSLTARGDA